ncbi:hypothetical protein MYX07_00880 [Patescibacteria group bacterium AH-259-L07]|nr:hypothetical protein [Patescibacteria group bacterium AH-259-L07]
MRIKVTFREYDKPYVDPDTGEEDRGEYLGSFTEEIEDDTLAGILQTATRKAEEYSKERSTDVRVWEVPVTVTPRGIR